jgi:hypothetical protein
VRTARSGEILITVAFDDVVALGDHVAFKLPSCQILRGAKSRQTWIYRVVPHGSHGLVPFVKGRKIAPLQISIHQMSALNSRHQPIVAVPGGGIGIGRSVIGGIIGVVQYPDPQPKPSPATGQPQPPQPGASHHREAGRERRCRSPGHGSQGRSCRHAATETAADRTRGTRRRRSHPAHATRRSERAARHRPAAANDTSAAAPISQRCFMDFMDASLVPSSRHVC